MVVRSQGGNNAGHTVVVGGDVYKLQLIPSGILYKNCVNIVGPGVVVDPRSILEEMGRLSERGVDLSNLFIDARAHVIMPWHNRIDALSEEARGAENIGTTKKGIGPCYMDKAQRSGIRMHDFIIPDRLRDFIKRQGEIKNRYMAAMFGADALDLYAMTEEYLGYAEKLRGFVRDTSVMTFDALKAGKTVLFEGAQGTLLDLDMGTYPYVTSSHPVAGGACIGSGIGPSLINECIGVAKAYTTRVGKGPFPTELFDETGDYIRNRGGEFGTVTGRPRRTGWFDAVVARYSVRINGLTELIINKIDPLSGLEKLRLCTAYRLNGEIIRDFPPDFSLLSSCEPIYEDFDGFSEDISSCRKYADLPKNVREYVEAIESVCGCPVRSIGVGPDRDQVVSK